MKNYVIGTLMVVILILSSIIYKKETSLIQKFPKPDTSGITDVEIPLFLYVFFSKDNCRDCLDIMEVLNNLPPHFIVTGFTPRKELENEKELRRATGAAFPIMRVGEYRKHIPWYTPTIYGVSPDGDVLFVLPGVPNEKEYLLRFLNSLYERVYPILLDVKMAREIN